MAAETEEQPAQVVQENRPTSAKSETKQSVTKDDENMETGGQKGDPDVGVRLSELGDDPEGESSQQHPGETEDEELTDDAEVLKRELDKIRLATPVVEIDPSEIFDPDDFPESYKENVPKEKLVLGYSDNFKRQYAHLYRDRKPLLLNPVNECGVEKFVCTTIRPTQLPFKDLYDWDGAAEFVADYLDFKTLEPPHERPRRMLSPTTVLARQKGNCFEYSVLLCSLLIGAGYDAYVVSGYASKETCLMNETREICPLLKKKEELKEAEKQKPTKKYTVRPPKDLRSKFLRKQEARAKKEKEMAEEKLRKEEEDRQAELDKPSPDSLYGLRVHSWVLVLEGKREVAEGFFIEPFTGIAHSMHSENYHGIESIWNHQNYWVNMQLCREGCKKIKYDLGDCTLWEYMFPSNDKPTLQIPNEDELLEGLEEEENAEDIEKHLDMPPSWVAPIKLSARDFQMRCPQGKKTKLYKRAKLEKFAHYLMKDGLVSRLSVFEDRELLDRTQIKEFYAHRVDKLKHKVHNERTGWVSEYYHPGRNRCLQEHRYRASAPGPENDRTMTFYHDARVDGLQRRMETPMEMTETFINRDDFLYYRYVEFGKRVKKFGPAEEANPRPIVKMVEKYHRNPSKKAGDDVAELIYATGEERIQITYHTEEENVSACTREFIKPPNADEKGSMIMWHPDNHVTYQVDPKAGDKKKVVLYQMLVDLLKAEEKCRLKVRESENEVRNILNERTREELVSELEISVYDTERNEKARMHRQELERLEQEEKLRRQEMELDYLAPFLAQLGISGKISRQEAYRLKEDCLADLKQRLVDKANLIQARFEKETAELQKKQAWYQQNQVSMQKDDEEEYLNYCSEAMFRIHILELRLQRHKEMAPKKYMALEHKIKADARLADYF